MRRHSSAQRAQAAAHSLAVTHLMLSAFIAACLADVCALLTDDLCQFASARHIAGNKTTYLRAVDVQCDHRAIIFTSCSCRQDAAQKS